MKTVFTINVEQDDDIFEVFEERVIPNQDGVPSKYRTNLGTICPSDSNMFFAEHPLHGKQHWQNFSRALAYLISPRGMT